MQHRMKRLLLKSGSRADGNVPTFVLSASEETPVNTFLLRKLTTIQALLFSIFYESSELYGRTYFY